MSINGFGNEWLQTDDGQNVYTNLANTSGPSNQEFLLPPSQPPVSMTSQPQPNVPLDWNSMVQAHPTPIEHQNHNFPGLPESNTSWNAYAYQQYDHEHQNSMTSQYHNQENLGYSSSSTTSDLALEMGPEEQPDEEYQNFMTSQCQNPEFVNKRVNNYPVRHPDFTNPNIPTNSMTSYSTWGQSGSDPTLEMVPEDNNWSMNKENQIYDVTDHPGHEYSESEREMTSQYQQPNDEFQEDSNPSKSEHLEQTSNSNDPLDAENPETVTIDTVEFREKVSHELKALDITPALFSKYVLGKHSKCASNMLRKDKNWDKMRVEVYNNFRRMYNWMEMPLDTKLAYFGPEFKCQSKRLTNAQREYLEATFQKIQNPTYEEKMEMAKHLQLTFTNVAIFFKNRRVKLRNWKKNNNMKI